MKMRMADKQQEQKLVRSKTNENLLPQQKKPATTAANCDRVWIMMKKKEQRDKSVEEQKKKKEQEVANLSVRKRQIICVIIVI